MHKHYILHTVLSKLKCYLSTVTGLFLEKAIKLFSELPFWWTLIIWTQNYSTSFPQIKINLSSDAK